MEVEQTDSGRSWKSGMYSYLEQLLQLNTLDIKGCCLLPAVITGCRQLVDCSLVSLLVAPKILREQGQSDLHFPTHRQEWAQIYYPLPDGAQPTSPPHNQTRGNSSSPSTHPLTD